MQFSDKIKLFYDGTNLSKYCAMPFICGITTNTSFMKQSGDTNYPLFYQANENHIRGMPISFQIFEEDGEVAYKQAVKISQYGPNTYVKVPVINTDGKYNWSLIECLLKDGIKVNITAVYTLEQVSFLKSFITKYSTPIIVSIFCGRISDTGRDPSVIVKETVDMFAESPNIEVLWAGTKEVLSIQHAINCGCQIITIPDSILDRINRAGKDLTELSRETVISFKKDAIDSHIVV